jgi:putative flippase GtrA
MQILTLINKKIFEFEVGRYIVNGLFATIIHYAMLTVNIEIIGFKSAGLANFVAAFFGIFASFMGNRYFVFKAFEKSFLNQSVMFILLYSLIAIVHGVILYVWTDLYYLDYRIGFVIASVVQFILSFSGNKLLVFKL